MKCISLHDMKMKVYHFLCQKKKVKKGKRKRYGEFGNILVIDLTRAVLMEKWDENHIGIYLEAKTAKIQHIEDVWL